MFCGLNVTASYMNNGGFWLAPITYNLQLHFKLQDNDVATVSTQTASAAFAYCSTLYENWFFVLFLSQTETNIDKGITTGYITNIPQWMWKLITFRLLTIRVPHDWLDSFRFSEWNMSAKPLEDVHHSPHTINSLFWPYRRAMAGTNKDGLG